MTHVQFIQEIENYYGAYEREATRTMVNKYIQKFSEKHLDRLYPAVLKAHSGEYKIVTPNIGIIERAEKGMQEWEERELPEFKKIDEKLPPEVMDKVGALWAKLKVEYPQEERQTITAEEDAKRMEAAKRELEAMRRRREK